MAVGYLSNISSLKAQRKLGESTRDLTHAYERLSSGLRINRASDDAAGLAVATNLNARARVYGQAVRNISDGISALAIAEGATSLLSNVVGRLKELATSSANGSYSRIQRLELDREATALTREWNRIVATTSFNGRNLFDTSSGDLSIQLGYGNDGRIGFAIGSGISRNQGSGQFVDGDTDGGLVNSVQESVTGDFNGDGRLDTAIAQGGGRLQVYTTNAAGNIVALNDINTGAVISRIATSDFNGDGISDIVVSLGTSVRAYLGTSSGVSSSGTDIATGGNIRGLVVGDLNGDGRDDIAFAGNGGNLTSYLGNGDGTFQFRSSVSIGANPFAMRSGDFNGDGKLDVVVALSNTALTTYLGDGTGQFQFGTTTTLNGTGGFTVPESLTVGDINHDGMSDFVALTNSGAEVHIASSGGGFTGSVISSDARAIYLTDINGDGDLDLLGASSSTTHLASLRYGRGDGTFGAVELHGNNALSGDVGLSIGDFNGDGVADFFAADYTNFQLVVVQQGVQQSASVQRFDLTSQAGARATLSLLDRLLERLAKENGLIGSNQSRLLSALNTITTTRENYHAASSRLADADIAGETARLTRLQILQQSATSVLSQANQAPALALTLLRS